MKRVLFVILCAPIGAQAQSNDPVGDALRQIYGNQPQLVAPVQPPLGVAIQPVIPVPRDRGPWGTGYSVVTSTKERRNLFDRDLTGQETVQRVVPNDALGQPIRGLDLGW